MHTSVFNIDGAEVRVHHNADWSGEVDITFPETTDHVIRLPGKLLLQLGQKAALEHLRAKLYVALASIEPL